MKRVLAVLIAFILTLATARLIFSVVSAQALVQIFRTAHWTSMLVAFVLIAFVQWIRAWRFSVLTFGSSACPDRRFAGISFQLNLLNFVLPFRIGELGYPIMMHRLFGQRPIEAIGVLLLARLLDLCVVGGILLGFGAWLEIAGTGLPVFLLAVGSALLLLIPFLLILLGSKRIGSKIPSVRFSRVLLELGTVLKNLQPLKAQLLAMGLSLAVWLTFGVAAAFAARAVTAEISTPAALFAAAAGNLAFAVPVNGIAGLGPSQAVWVAAVTRTGVGMQDAVVSALAVYFVTLASAVIFGSLAFIMDWAGAVKSPARRTR